MAEDQPQNRYALLHPPVMFSCDVYLRRCWGQTMRRFRQIAVLVALSLVGTVEYATAQSELGLAERRALASFEQQRFPAIKAEIDKAATFELPLEVRWNEIALPGKAADYAKDEFWVNIYFRPLVLALSRVTIDQMGKDALKAKLKSVVVRYDQSTAPASNYANGLSFANGVLSINFQPWSNTGDIEPRAKAMQALLEKNL
ncbi:MAG: hypothetical protein ACRCUE_00365 [Bosea sp. (in: a-proteobacteria)]